MNAECSIALDGLSIIYMIILIISIKHKNKRELMNFQYCLLISMICVFLIFDIIYSALYGSPDLFFQQISKVVKSLYFIVNTMIVWIWAKFVDCIIFGPAWKGQRHRLFYTAILFINTAMVIVNFFREFLFGISSEGTFIVRPVAMWIFTVLNYLSIILAAIIIIRNRQSVKENIFLPLLIFPLPPFCAEIAQIFYRPFSFICTYAVSALILFQVSQNNTIYTDELTGLANRRLLNESLDKWFAAPKGAMVCGIMIDLDGLKHINDTYGHLCGDHALITMAEIIKSIKRKDILSARYGGDEFVLIWLSNDEDDLIKIEEMLELAKRQTNDSKPADQKIDFSLGSYCCCDKRELTSAEFLKRIDEEMYRSKKSKKERL